MSTGVQAVFASGTATTADGAYVLADRELWARVGALGPVDLVRLEHSVTSVVLTGSVLNAKTLEASTARETQFVVTLLATVRPHSQAEPETQR